MNAHRAWLAVGLVSLAVQVTIAQAKPPRAEVKALAMASPIRAGTQARLLLDVRLPTDVHVQSDKPRDRLLIPTELILKLPAGVSLDRIVYPKATDLVQSGRTEPLAVFSGRFTIEAHVAIAKDAPAGAMALAGQLKYQACDDSLCYAPARADVQWTLHVIR
jgi:hypothetical protein